LNNKTETNYQKARQQTSLLAIIMPLIGSSRYLLLYRYVAVASYIYKKQISAIDLLLVRNTFIPFPQFK
jgi:hypothetical protein